MTTTWFVLTRTFHIGACLVLFGIFAFDRFVAVPVRAAGPVEIAAAWNRCLRMARPFLLGIILVSGIAWFLLVAMDMTGLPLREAMRPENLGVVAGQTRFGAVWQLRLFFWIVVAVAGRSELRLQADTAASRSPVWIQLVGGGFLLGSLAWAGHGREGHPAAVHLVTDVVHLITAGFWPTGLLPLLVLLRGLSSAPDALHRRTLALLVHRFSAVSLGSVILLCLTGLANSWFLVGSITNLGQHPYGRWLLAKISLLGLAVLIGAVNLLVLKPRLRPDADPSEKAAATLDQLKLNVGLELLLGTVIVVIVAVLGLLPPTGS